jgi:hypothetical protein
VRTLSLPDAGAEAFKDPDDALSNTKLSSFGGVVSSGGGAIFSIDSSTLFKLPDFELNDGELMLTFDFTFSNEFGDGIGEEGDNFGVEDALMAFWTAAGVGDCAFVRVLMVFDLEWETEEGVVDFSFEYEEEAEPVGEATRDWDWIGEEEVDDDLIFEEVLVVKEFCVGDSEVRFDAIATPLTPESDGASVWFGDMDLGSRDFKWMFDDKVRRTPVNSCSLYGNTYIWTCHSWTRRRRDIIFIRTRARLSKTKNLFDLVCSYKDAVAMGFTVKVSNTLNASVILPVGFIQFDPHPFPRCEWRCSEKPYCALCGDTGIVHDCGDFYPAPNCNLWSGHITMPIQFFLFSN